MSLHGKLNLSNTLLLVIFFGAVAFGANYHASGVTSGVYLRPLDPSDGIYKGLYAPQLAFLQKWQNCERTLVFQNLTICKMKLDAQETKTAQLAEYYNKMRAQMDYLIKEFDIDVNDIPEPNVP